MFTFTLILIYFLMLLVVDKRNNTSAKSFSRDKGLSILVAHMDKISFTLSTIGLFLTLLTSFRETTPYFIILSLILIMNTLYVILRKPSGLVLGSFILWHLMMYSDKVPIIDVKVGEGSAMVREMRLNDHWEFKWAHNPAYNPLPTIAFLQATLSKITTMNWYSYYLGQIMFLSILIVYDLAIFTLTYTITKDSRAALMSIPLVGITPETPIHQHPYQWSGNALVLIATAMLARTIEREKPGINFTAIMLLFTGAILAHPTGILYIFLLIFLIFIAFPKHLLHREKTLVSFNTRWLIRILGILLIILIMRSMYTQEYLEYIIPPLSNIFQGLANLIREAFIPSEEIGGAGHIPLYERAGIPWIQAYAWSYALAVATAYVLYSLVKGRVRLMEFALYATCASFLLIMYIGYGLFKMTEFSSLNTRTYVFIPLTFPLVAKALTKVFQELKNGRTKMYLVTALLGLVLFAVTTPIAAQDPNISPIQYAKIRGIPQLEIDNSLLLKASISIEMTHSTNLDVLWIHSRDTFVKKIVYTGAGLKTEYYYSNTLIEAMELYSFLNRVKIPRLEALVENKYMTDRVIDLGIGEYVST
jgi:hypothetical protein